MLRYSITAFIVLAAASCSVLACEHSLDGVWKSDADTSMRYIRANSRLQEKTEKFLSTLLGKMTMTFSNGTLHQAAPDTEVNVMGRMTPFKGFDENIPYRVLLCNKSSIVWATKLSFATEEDATTFNFVDADTVWVYMGSTELNMPDIHGREFFKRVH